MSPTFAAAGLAARDFGPPAAVGGALLDGERAVGDVVGLGDLDFVSTGGSDFLIDGGGDSAFGDSYSNCCSGVVSRDPGCGCC